MKIALVHSFYSSQSPSGENVAVEAQASALRAIGAEVEIVASRTDDVRNGVGHLVRSAVTVASGLGPSPEAILRDFKPDIVHVHNLFPNWASKWLAAWDSPVVATLHNFRSMCAAGTLFRDGTVCTKCPDGSSVNAVRHACYRGSRAATIPLAIRTRNSAAGDPLLRRADRVIALTPRSRDLHAKYGVDLSRIDVVPNFVSDVGFAPDAAPAGHWVYIGRLSEEKGILNCVRHWPPSQSLRVYGDGPLRTQIAKAAGPSVTLHGAVARSEVPAILSGARGLVFPSEWFEGGIPLAYVEALAAGRPVLAKSGSSAADDVAISGSGVLFDEWSELAGALTAIEFQAQSLGRAGRKHFDREFNQKAWTAQIQRVYEAADASYRASHA